MNKQSIITALLALVAMAGQGQVKCHVEGTVVEGTKAVGLAIYRDGTDPKDSPLKLTAKDGHFECDVEDNYFLKRFGFLGVCCIRKAKRRQEAFDSKKQSETKQTKKK